VLACAPHRFVNLTPDHWQELCDFGIQQGEAAEKLVYNNKASTCLLYNGSIPCPPQRCRALIRMHPRKTGDDADADGAVCAGSGGGVGGLKGVRGTFPTIRSTRYGWVGIESDVATASSLIREFSKVPSGDAGEAPVITAS
jgi:hypothetical protein